MHPPSLPRIPAMTDETVLDEHLAALNAHDLERVMATYATRPVVVVNDKRLEGRADVRGFHASIGFTRSSGASFSHLHVEEQRRDATDDAIVSTQTLSGLHTGT